MIVVDEINDVALRSGIPLRRLELRPAVQGSYERTIVFGDPVSSELSAALHRVGAIVSTDSPTIQFSGSSEWASTSMPRANQQTIGWTATPEVKIDATFRWSIRTDDEALYVFACVDWIRTAPRGHFGVFDVYAGHGPDLMIMEAFGDVFVSRLPVLVESWSMDVGPQDDLVEIRDSTDALLGVLNRTTEMSVSLRVARSSWRWLRKFSYGRLASGELILEEGGWL